MSKNKHTTADTTSLIFMVMYLAGAIYNASQGIWFYALLWTALFIINAGLFIYRKHKQK